MKRLIACLVLTSALTAAACDDPQQSNEPETADVAMEAPVAPSAEDVAVPTTAPAVDTPPADSTTLPADRKSSEESVQPESETLFY